MLISYLVIAKDGRAQSTTAWSRDKFEKVDRKESCWRKCGNSISKKNNRITQRNRNRKVIKERKASLHSGKGVKKQSKSSIIFR